MNSEIKINKTMGSIDNRRTEALAKVSKTIRSCETEEQLESCKRMIDNYKKLFLVRDPKNGFLWLRDVALLTRECNRVSMYKLKTFSRNDHN